MHLLIDTSQRPLLRIVVGPEPTLEHFDAIFATVVKEFSRHRSFCVLTNAEHTQRIGFAHARRVAQFGEQHRKLIEAYVQALAFVIPSPMVAAAIRLGFQLKPPPHPIKICRTVDEAESYLAPYLRHMN